MREGGCRWRQAGSRQGRAISFAAASCSSFATRSNIRHPLCSERLQQARRSARHRPPPTGRPALTRHGRLGHPRRRRRHVVRHSTRIPASPNRSTLTPTRTQVGAAVAQAGQLGRRAARPARPPRAGQRCELPAGARPICPLLSAFGQVPLIKCRRPSLFPLSSALPQGAVSRVSKLRAPTESRILP